MDSMKIPDDVEKRAKRECRLAGMLPGVLWAPIETVLDWGRSGSLYPVTFGLACCALEMMACGFPRWDMGRFGSEAFRASPRQADLMFVAGTVTKKMAPRARRIYEQMPEPKWVISLGSCANTGGPYRHSYNVVKADDVVPVDVYVHGCPIRPEAIEMGLIRLMKKIQMDNPGHEILEKLSPTTDWLGREPDYEELLGKEFENG